MPRARDGRLTRLAVRHADAGTAEAIERCTLRARLAICNLVRDGLARAGVDPSSAAALCHGEAAAAELAGFGDTAELRTADEAAAGIDGDDATEILAAKIAALARRSREGQLPDLANASLAELSAWCLVRHAEGETGPNSA